MAFTIGGGNPQVPFMLSALEQVLLVFQPYSHTEDLRLSRAAAAHDPRAPGQYPLIKTGEAS